MNRGGRTPQNEKCLSPNVPPGTALRATDREYVVKASGQWVRKPDAVDITTGEPTRADIPMTKSQLAFPAAQKKNKYPKAATHEELLPGSA